MSVKRIQLISPPALGLKDKLSYPPLGLLYLAANLSGPYDITISNMVKIDDFQRLDADIYGVSIHSSSSYPPAKDIIAKIKSIDPKALIVAGGAFPTSLPRFILEETAADIVVMGEGERVFDNICKGLKPADIRGISYRGASGISVNELEPLIEDLDSIAFPARNLLPVNMIKHEGGTHHSDQPATTIFGTRGCVFNCGFCDTELWRRVWRARSPQNIIDEIEQVKKEYGIAWFRFPDDCMNLDRKWFTDFCRKISPAQVFWTILSRADTLDPEILREMKASGCREVFFGFETGSQKLLDLMGKRISVEQNIKAVQMCREAGIASCAYMMFGFPGEDERTVKETKDFLLAAKPDKSRISQFIPVPGSQVWNNPQKYGIKIKGNFSSHWYFDSPELGIEYENISQQRMIELRREMMLFYQEQGYLRGWEDPK